MSRAELHVTFGRVFRARCVASPSSVSLFFLDNPRKRRATTSKTRAYLATAMLALATTACSDSMTVPKISSTPSSGQLCNACLKQNTRFTVATGNLRLQKAGACLRRQVSSCR